MYCSGDGGTLERAKKIKRHVEKIKYLPTTRYNKMVSANRTGTVIVVHTVLRKVVCAISCILSGL